jgi:putative hemolysin
VTSTLTNIALVLVFILVGGFFAATEMALVSLRESQINALAQRGKRGTRLKSLAANPNRYLAALQIGVTFAGFLSAAFGAATLADDLAPVLEGWGLSKGAANTVALVGITVIISYLSLVFGELVPKRLALQRAESLALVVAPVIDTFARLTRPLVWLLSASTNGVVRLLGGDPHANREAMSDEELRTLVAGHESLEPEERRLIEEVFEAGDRSLREVMLPRTEVDFLDAATPVFKAIREAAVQAHSRYPVVDGSPDDVVGFVHVRDLFDPDLAGRSVRVGELARPVLRMPDSKQVLPALTEMRSEGQHLAIVVDEYGGTAGIVTLEDLVEELIGDIRDEYDPLAAETRRHGGELEVDGLLNLDEFAEESGFELPEGPYDTVAGFVVAALGRLPRLGDAVEVGGHVYAVVDLDGRRLSRVRVTVAAKPAEPAGPPPPAGGHAEG